MNEVKFKSPEKMLEFLYSDDLFNLDTGEYIFLYSDTGSIASYSLELGEAKKLAEVACKNNEYWGAMLGPGGWIYDPANECESIEDSNINHIKAVIHNGRWFATTDLQGEWFPDL